MMKRWQRSIQIHYSTSSSKTSTTTTSSVSSSSWLTTEIQRVLLSVVVLGVDGMVQRFKCNKSNQYHNPTLDTSMYVGCFCPTTKKIPVYFVPRGWTDGPNEKNHGNRIYRSRTNGSTENVSPMKMSIDVVIKFLYWPSKCLLGNVAFRTRQPSPLLPVTHLV